MCNLTDYIRSYNICHVIWNQFRTTICTQSVHISTDTHTGVLSVSILSSPINFDFRVSHHPTTCHFLLCHAGSDRVSAGRPVTPHLSNNKQTKEKRKDAGRRKETQRDAGRQMDPERDETRMHKQQCCHLRRLNCIKC